MIIITIYTNVYLLLKCYNLMEQKHTKIKKTTRLKVILALFERNLTIQFYKFCRIYKYPLV
ncbi:MAG: hypothetical protein JWR54_1125 [Mucilaginibacter sp.]|nr:hypothetical protein [Mucilaginibacter sp.]